MRTIGTIITLLSLCLTASISVAAQVAATANLSGRVLDQNGAAVPGAEVTVTQKATGAERTTTTNSEGSFAELFNWG